MSTEEKITSPIHGRIKQLHCYYCGAVFPDNPAYVGKKPTPQDVRAEAAEHGWVYGVLIRGLNQNIRLCNNCNCRHQLNRRIPGTKERSFQTRPVFVVTYKKSGALGKFLKVKRINADKISPRANKRTIRTTLIGLCVDMERRLNNGLLWEEAEAAYARAGFYDKEIYRVRAEYKNHRNGKWNPA